MGRMEIERGLSEKRKSREQAGEEEKGASRAGERSSVVDFDFLFEFSPERPRAEADLRFEQDQSQQVESQAEGGRGASSRRAEVRPYPAPEMRGTNKLEKSRQSARECRARKKLRYQYLDDMILEREKANDALREELTKYVGWCQMLDQSQVPDGLQELLTTTPESWK